MKKILIIFLFASCVINLNAQNWLMYTTSNSNSPYNSYTCFGIDTANSKWFNKPNGFGAQTIFFDNDTTWQTSNNIIGSTVFNCVEIQIDKKNSVWERDDNNIVYSLINGIGGSWQKHTAASTGVQAMDEVYDIAVDDLSNKWFGGYYGLVKYNDTTFVVMDTTNSNLPFEPVYRTAVDKDNNIWIEGDSNFAKFDGANWQIYSKPFPGSLILQHRLAIDSSNFLWVVRSPSSDGIYKFDGSIWTNYITSNSTIPTNSLRVLAIDKNGYVWIGYTGGIANFDGIIWTSYGSGEGYPSTGNALAMHVDRYNNKWICTVDGIVVFNETGVVGVHEINKQMAALNLYPNPAKDLVTMSIEAENPESVTLTILNSLCQSVKAETHSVQKGKNDIQIDVSILRSGIYFVQVQSSKGVVSKKIIKQ